MMKMMQKSENEQYAEQFYANLNALKSKTDKTFTDRAYIFLWDLTGFMFNSVLSMIAFSIVLMIFLLNWLLFKLAWIYGVLLYGLHAGIVMLYFNMMFIYELSEKNINYEDDDDKETEK